MNTTKSKIPPTAKYIGVILLITVLFFVVFIGAALFPKETPNMTANYKASLNIGEYTFSVSDAKYDTATGELRINLYHMKAEPDTPESDYFLQVYEEENRNSLLTYKLESTDKQNTVLVITGAAGSWQAVSIDILTLTYEGQPESSTVTIDKRDMTSYDSRQIVYVYVTPTPAEE